jgi:prevent-host-death family protein
MGQQMSAPRDNPILRVLTAMSLLRVETPYCGRGDIVSKFSRHRKKAEALFELEWTDQSGYYSSMRQVSVTELKNRLSQYLRLVRRGETIEVLERSVPVARLSGIGEDHATGDGGLERLLRDGIVTRARRKAGKSWLKEPPVPCRGDVVRTLIEERGRD